MAAGMFLFSAVDTQAKLLTDTLHPGQIVWSRQMGLFVGALILLGTRGPSLINSSQPVLQSLRGLLVAGSSTLFTFALIYVPLADAIAVSFVAPFFVTLMGALLLKEHVDFRRWVAVSLGFIGVLIIVRPGTGAIHPAVLLVVIAAFLFALRQILSRWLGRVDPIETTITYTALVSGVALSLPLPFVWRSPATTMEFFLMIGMAVPAAAAEILVIKALEVAQAVVIAPVHYTLIVWGTLYGFLVFNQLPDIWTWIGTIIIITTGIYSLNRERQLPATI